MSNLLVVVVFVCCIAFVSCEVKFLLASRSSSKSFFVDPYLLDQIEAYNSRRDTVLLIHGFRASRSSDYVVNLRDSLVRNTRENVILVDWEEEASGSIFGLTRVANNTKSVGNAVCDFIKKSCLKPKSVHCIGSGLGAHVCGFVGKCLSGKLRRITGLDPTGNMFSFAFLDDRLDSRDASFVDIIRTSPESMKIPIGTVEFFPNGGRNQAACFGPKSSAGCEEELASYLFAESTDARCGFTAVKCLNVDFTRGICNEFSTNPLDVTQMGYHTRANGGYYYLNTNPQPPFSQT